MFNVRLVILFIVSILAHTELGAMESPGNGAESKTDYSFLYSYCMVNYPPEYESDKKFFAYLNEKFFPLCDNGLNPHKIRFIGYPIPETFLIFACRKDNQDLLERLLKYHGAEAIINNQDRKGNTALHYACLHANINMVKTLLNIPNINHDIINRDGKRVLGVVQENMSLSYSREKVENSIIIYRMLIDKFEPKRSPSKL